MQDEVKSETTRKFERLAKEDDTRLYVLRLYVTGMTPRSQRAIASIKEICENHLKDRYSLEVVDILQHPILAEGEQIIAAFIFSNNRASNWSGSRKQRLWQAMFS